MNDKKSDDRFYSVEEHPFIRVVYSSDSDESSLFQDDDSESEYLRE